MTKIWDIRAREAFDKFSEILEQEKKKTVLDIGCGYDQPHTSELSAKGFNVFTNDIFYNNDYIGLFVDIDFDKQFDGVWCSHCLEHQENVGLFLRKIHSVTKEGGYVSITVPPLKHDIVGGHLTLWNLGLLYYNLILAGFDCSEAIHKQYGYNISVIVKKKTITDMPILKYDNGDIASIAKYFPFEAFQGFKGNEIPDTF